MTSLGSFYERLADLLKLKVADLYERQRRLLASKLLTRRKGRGPGSGIQATPDNLGLLLIAVAATGTLRDVVQATEAIAESTPKGGGVCPFTGKDNFRDALAFVLAADPNQGFDSVMISRTDVRARIRRKVRGKYLASVFVGEDFTSNKSKGLQLQAVIGKLTLRNIHRELVAPLLPIKKRPPVRLRIRTKLVTRTVR